MNTSTPDASTWKAIVTRFQQPSTGRATWQLVNTFVPYALLWYGMYRSLAVSPWLTMALAVPAAGFLVRIFIIFHDCGHGSFFRGRRANELTGSVAGLLTLTPFRHWRREHALHHASSGDLDRRGSGDIWTMTVDEYLKSGRWVRIAYRVMRNPFVLLVVAPVYVFVIDQRFAVRGARPRERRSVHWMNLAILAMACALSLVMGIKAYLLIQLTVTALAGAAGVWLFYVQHQFEGVYWARGAEWDPTAAALQGSSFYKMPRVLQWFSGNIGFHHIHHLSPHIPNYNLQRCHDADPLFQQVRQLTVLESFRSLRLRLWDETRRQLVGFRHLKQ